MRVSVCLFSANMHHEEAKRQAYDNSIRLTAQLTRKIYEDEATEAKDRARGGWRTEDEAAAAPLQQGAAEAQRRHAAALEVSQRQNAETRAQNRAKGGGVVYPWGRGEEKSRRRRA